MVRRSQLKRLAKQQLKRNWGIALGAITLCSAMSVVAFMIGGPALANVVAVGLVAAYMAIVRTGKANIVSIFDGWKSFGPAFIAGILVPLYTFFWSLLFWIPGIIKSYAYAMTNYIIKDNPDITAKEAITESRRLMRGNKWRLFVLDLSFIGWDILCVLTLGILTVYVVPYKMATRAAFYDAVKQAKEQSYAEETYDYSAAAQYAAYNASANYAAPGYNAPANYAAPAGYDQSAPGGYAPYVAPAPTAPVDSTYNPTSGQ